MLPGDGWQWESLIATCSHAAPRSSLHRPSSPKTPVNCHSLPVQGGEWAVGAVGAFLICIANESLQKGLQGRGRWEFRHCLLAKRGQRCLFQRSRQGI